MEDEKQIRWIGSAYDDLLAFPKDSRREAGFQLGKVQAGLEPTDWKPFDDVGVGTREIRNCFQKKTQVTSRQNEALARARYRAVVNARKEKE